MAILKNFMKYVSFNVLGMIGLSCYILADTFFISKVLGANGLAALNISLPIFSIISGIGLMLGIGGGTKFSIAKLKSNVKSSKKTFTSVLCLGVIMGVILALIGIFFASPIVTGLGANHETFAASSTYLKIIMCYSPAFILNNILIAFVRNDGNPLLSMMAMVIGSLSNIALDYLFMFPLGMGMFGAALATGLAPVVSILVLLIHFARKKNNFVFSFKAISIKEGLSVIPLGISSFTIEISSAIVMVLFNYQILRLAGNVGLAAYGIIANIALICIAIFTGIAHGIQPLISDAYGKKNDQVIKKVSRYAYILTISFAILFYIIGSVFSDNIINIFNSEGNKQLIEIAKTGILIYFAGFIFAGINIVRAAYLSAIMKAKAAFLISLTRGLIAIIPLALILPLFLDMTGVWLSYLLAEGVAFILCMLTINKNKVHFTDMSLEKQVV